MNLRKYLQHPVFTAISECGSQLDVKAYVIGGFVRDAILRKPSKDVDIVVEGSGIELAKELAKHNNSDRNVSYFKNFGTAMLQYDDMEVEFVGARKESYQRNSRKPIVEDGTLEDDQKRRDFTINALSLSLQEDNFGELYDPFDGLSDLKKGIIRTPQDPSTTYSDDPLRMMRAIRFAAQLEFTIEEKSLTAISQNKERIKIVSQERIADELNKIIMAPVPSIGFKLLFDTGLLEIIFPEMAALQGVDVIHGKGHKDNFYHTLQVLDNISENTEKLWLRWAAVLHDIAKPPTKYFHPKQGWTFHGHDDLGAKMVPKIFKKLRLPLDSKMKYVQKLVRLHLRPISLSKDVVTDSGVRRLLYDAGEDLEDLMTLCEADITSKNETKVKRYLKNFEKVRQKLKTVEEKDRIRNLQPPVSGEIIMQTFGLAPSKEVGILKAAIKEAILEGEIQNNFESAYEFMVEEGKKMGLTMVKEKS